jgi:hypothetical protein
MYVYANPVNLTDPSGHDPWWCDEQSNPELCYAKWIIDHGGEPTSDILEVYYEWSPDEALDMLQDYFNIQLPGGFDFRFAYWGRGGFSSDEELNEGMSPWFIVEQVLGSDFQEWYLGDGSCVLVSTNIPGSIEAYDNTVFIFDLAFTNYEFYPDDVASIMFHESVHAWQEFLAIQQIGSHAGTVAFYNQYRNGLERQAYEMEKSLNGIRINLSQTRLTVIEARRPKYSGGDPSPFILPAGVP